MLDTSQATSHWRHSTVVAVAPLGDNTLVLRLENSAALCLPATQFPTRPCVGDRVSYCFREGGEPGELARVVVGEREVWKRDSDPSEDSQP